MPCAVQRLLENPLSECLLDGFAIEGDEVTVSMEDGEGGGSVSGSGMWGGEGIMLSNTRGRHTHMLSTTSLTRILNSRLLSFIASYDVARGGGRSVQHAG